MTVLNNDSLVSSKVLSSFSKRRSDVTMNGNQTFPAEKMMTSSEMKSNVIVVYTYLLSEVIMRGRLS